MYCVIKCIVRGNHARVKNADLRHPYCTVKTQICVTGPQCVNLDAKWEREWSTPRPGRLTSGREPRYPLQRRLCGAQGRSGGVWRRLARGESLYRVRHPHLMCHYWASQDYVLRYLSTVAAAT